MWVEEVDSICVKVFLVMQEYSLYEEGVAFDLCRVFGPIVCEVMCLCLARLSAQGMTGCCVREVMRRYIQGGGFGRVSTE